MIRHNWVYKLLALAVALGLWTYVRSERNPITTKTFTVPITYENPKGYIAELTVKEVTIAIEGPRSVVDEIGKDDIKASIDLTGLKAGEKTVAVRVDFAEEASNKGIDYEVKPVNVKVVVMPLGKQRFNIELKFPPTPLGYSYSVASISPDSVSVSGPVEQVDQVKRVVLNIPPQNPNGNVDGLFELTPLDENGSVVSGLMLDPDKVRLQAKLVEVPATKEVIVSPNIVGTPKFPARVVGVTVSPPTVVLSGKPNLLIEITSVSTNQVSIQDAESPVSRVVTLKLPQGIKALGRGSVLVNVQILPQ